MVFLRDFGAMDRTLNPSPWTALKWTTPKNTISDEWYVKKLRLYIYTTRWMLFFSFCIASHFIQHSYSKWRLKAMRGDAERKEKHPPCCVRSFLACHSSEIVFLRVVHFRAVHQGSPWTRGQCFVHHPILVQSNPERALYHHTPTFLMQLNPFTPHCAESKIDKFSKIANWVKLKNKQTNSTAVKYCSTAFQ